MSGAADAAKAGYEAGVTLATKAERERVARELRALVAVAPRDDAGSWLTSTLVGFARDLSDQAEAMEDYAATHELSRAVADAQAISASADSGAVFSVS